MTVCFNADALELAHQLAGLKDGHVALLNGANRKLIGNHWFGGGARIALNFLVSDCGMKIGHTRRLVIALKQRTRQCNGLKREDRMHAAATAAVAE